MLLRVRHRLLFLNLLPQVGDITQLRVVREAQLALSFSSEEIGALKFRQEGNTTHWDSDAPDPPLDIYLSDATLGILTERIKELDSQKKLPMEFLPLYEHLVEGKDWDSEAA